MFPDYEGGGILNLMAGLQNAMGGDSEYPPLEFGMDPSSARHLILIVLDGLGAHFLQRHGEGSFLARHRVRDLSSVFLSTTASAMTTFYSAAPPLRHALTGWFVYLREIGAVSAILPMTTRSPRASIPEAGIPVETVLDFPRFFQAIDRPSVGIFPDHVVNTPFSLYATAGSRRLGYSTMPGFANRIREAVRASTEPDYIFAYWPAYDKSCHLHGTSHWRTVHHFRRLDALIEKLAADLAGTGSLIMVTADHGMIDVPPENVHWLSDYPMLADSLVLPLSGEPRMPYCHVRLDMEGIFLEEIQRIFGTSAQLFDRERILREGWYGRGVMNPKLPDRVGDYVLMFDDARVLRDVLPGEKKYDFVGYHGAMSEEEMLVPLVMVEC